MATLAAPGVSATARSRTDVTDNDLVEAVRAGDDCAFERLYERYYRRIATYIFGMVRDRGRAEDLTQEVFVSALRRMRQTDRPIHFKPWIYEIAKNACIDAFRRTRRAEEVSFDAELEAGGGADAARLAAPAAAVPDAAVEGKQRLDHLWGAFDGLSDAHHQILVMRELEGLTYAEIGERLGMSKASVESTLFRARRRLTEEFEELQTGAACARVLGLIAGAEAGSGALGRRDQRRVGQHIARCTPCRREAVMAGLDAAVMARRPIRTKLGALLPLPAFLKRRWFEGADAQVAQWSAAASSYGDAPAGWLKAVAAVAAVALAGAGAGTVVTGQADGLDRPAPSAPGAAAARAHGGAAGAAASTGRASGRGAATAKARGGKGAGAAGSHARVVRSAGGERSTGGTQRRASGGRDGGGSGGGSGSGSGGTTSSGTSGAGATGGGGSTSGSGATTTSGGSSKPLVSPNPSALTQPSSDPAPTTVGGVVEDTTNRVGETVGGAAGDTVQQVGSTVGETVDQTPTTVTDTVHNTVDAADTTVQGVTGGVTRTVQTTTQTTQQTVDGVTSTVGDVVGGLGGR